MFEVGANGPCQNDRLEVSSFPRELGHRVAVGHTCDLLVEDRSFVEFFGHVVRGGPDQLHTPVMSLAVGVGSDEGREERVMNVDDPRSIGVDQDGRQDLHVAGQHHEIDVE